MGAPPQRPPMASPDSDRLAVLIDADNAQPGVIGELLAEVAMTLSPPLRRDHHPARPTGPGPAGW